MTRLAMVRGDTRAFTVTLTDESDAPLDLTDLSLAFTAKRRHGDADDDAVIRKTIGVGIEVTDAEGGEATITIDPADTRDLTNLRTLVWDLQVESADGTDVRTPLSGRFVITADVTREQENDGS